MCDLQLCIGLSPLQNSTFSGVTGNNQYLCESRNKHIHGNILFGSNGEFVEAAVGTFPYLWAIRLNDGTGALL